MGFPDGVGPNPQPPQLIANGDGPIDRAVKSPFGPTGTNYASMVVLTESNGDQTNLVGRQKPDGRDHGIGFGIGVGENNGKRQYFVGVRYIDGATPTTRLAVSAERTSADPAIMNRSVPTLTTTFAAPLGKPLKGSILGDDSVSLSAVGTRFDNPSVHLLMTGVTSSVSASAGGVTLASRNDTWQVAKNFGSKDVRNAVQTMIAGSRADEIRQRPLAALDDRGPALYSNAYTVGYTKPDGKPDPSYPFGGRVTATATFPIDESRVPKAYKSVIDRVEAAQNLRDPAARERAVTQIESDLRNSPQLEAGMIRWEQQQVLQAGPHLEQSRPQQPQQNQQPDGLRDFLQGVGRAAEGVGEGASEVGGVLKGLWDFVSGGPGHAF